MSYFSVQRNWNHFLIHSKQPNNIHYSEVKIVHNGEAEKTSYLESKTHSISFKPALKIWHCTSVTKGNYQMTLHYIDELRFHHSTMCGHLPSIPSWMHAVMAELLHYSLATHLLSIAITEFTLVVKLSMYTQEF